MEDIILPQRLVRKRQLAEIISVSMRTVDYLMKGRVIPFVRVRGLILFDVEQVVDALKKYERKTAK